MKRLVVIALLLLPITLAAADSDSSGAGCTEASSRSGVNIAPAIPIQRGPDGLTIEQKNINDRLKMDNTPGSIKHLYVISAYSGQVLIYSTVRGKVTSSGKRLSPSASSGSDFNVSFGNSTMYTKEVLSDDGTYGASVEYLYWWDTRGIYHQHYVQGGQILHISDQPVAVKSIVLNMESQ